MLLAAVIATACSPPPSGDGWLWSDGGPALRVEWSDGAVSLDVGGLGTAVWWGLAETHPGCGDNCWTGEDCVFGGDDGEGGFHGTCHSVRARGLTLPFGETPDSLAPSVGTVFWSPRYERAVTHYVEDALSGRCWVFGHDPSYFDGEPCDVLEDEE
jgi:hypothetical protein